MGRSYPTSRKKWQKEKTFKLSTLSASGNKWKEVNPRIIEINGRSVYPLNKYNVIDLKSLWSRPSHPRKHTYLDNKIILYIYIKLIEIKL